MTKKQKLELTWIGKDARPKLDPRILLEDPARSYHAKHRVKGGRSQITPIHADSNLNNNLRESVQSADEEKNEENHYHRRANGAGKTTFTRAFLPEEAQCPRFSNADLIASGLLPFAPETAAVELAIARVAERVKQGGHNIPEPVIRRRFASGRKNFDQHYRAWVDAWALYDNSGDEPQLMEWGGK